MQRVATGVNASGEPIRKRQMPGITLVHCWSSGPATRALSASTPGTDSRAEQGSAAATAPKARPFASDRRLNIFKGMVVFLVIVKVLCALIVLKNDNLT